MILWHDKKGLLKGMNIMLKIKVLKTLAIYDLRFEGIMASFWFWFFNMMIKQQTAILSREEECMDFRHNEDWPWTVVPVEVQG